MGLVVSFIDGNFNYNREKIKPNSCEISRQIQIQLHKNYVMIDGE